MAFTPRDWTDGELVTAAKMEDLETRLSAYSDLVGGGGGSGDAFTVITSTGGNDTSLFTAAISALPATGGVIVCPDANYKVTSVSIPAAPKTVTIIGSGIGQTTIQQNASSISSTTQQFDLNASGAVLRMRDLTLQGPTTVTGANIFNLIHQDDGDGGLIDLENVRLYKFGYGIWSENQYIRCVNCIFDGGSAGTAMGSSVGGQGILHAYHATGGQLELDDCQFTACGHGSSNLYHGLYIEPGVDSNVRNCRFEDTYGTGFHTQHFGTEVGAKYINYENCYFGPFHTALVGAGFSVPADIPCNFINCVFELQDNSIITGANNGNLKMINCTFLGASGGNQQIAVVNTGTKVTLENCEFNGNPPDQIYCNSNGFILNLTNNKFTGACSNDVELDTGLTTAEINAYKNRHTGATVNNYKLASGKRIVIDSNVFLGTVSGACVNNLSGSTVDTLNIIDNEFAQSGNGVTLTATPTRIRRLSNYGTKWIVDTRRPKYFKMPTGAIAETIDRESITQVSATTSGQLVLMAIELYEGMIISNFNLQTAGTGLSGGTDQWMALFTGVASAPVMVATTADQALSTMASLTKFTWPVATIAAGSASSYTVPSDGMYYIGTMLKATTVCNMPSAPTVSAQADPMLAMTANTGLTTARTFPFTATGLAAAGAYYHWWLS